MGARSPQRISAGSGHLSLQRLVRPNGVGSSILTPNDLHLRNCGTTSGPWPMAHCDLLLL